MAGVALWAENNRFEYVRYGDEFFDVLPAWYRQKLEEGDLSSLIWRV